MDSIYTRVTQEDVYWAHGQEDGTTEMIFDDNMALARLLINEVVFLNDHWWKDEWSDEAKKTFSINVNCNDSFYYACADAEECFQEDLQDLYDHWAKDPHYGTMVWCAKKRKMFPLSTHCDAIRKAGIWDIDNMGLESQWEPMKS